MWDELAKTQQRSASQRNADIRVCFPGLAPKELCKVFVGDGSKHLLNVLDEIGPWIGSGITLWAMWHQPMTNRPAWVFTCIRLLLAFRIQHSFCLDGS